MAKDIFLCSPYITTHFGMKNITVPWEGGLYMHISQCWQQSGVVATLRNNCSNPFIEDMVFDCGNNALPGYVLNKNMG